MKAFLTFNILMTVSFNVLSATYEVPVKSELKKYASFELTGFSKIEKDGNIKIKYELPNVLTGSPEVIELEADNYTGLEDFILKGEHGEAKCHVKKPITKCAIEYTNLVIDEKLATDEILKISTHGLEASKRIEVMKAFSTDPVGIVTY